MSSKDCCLMVFHGMFNLSPYLKVVWIDLCIDVLMYGSSDVFNVYVNRLLTGFVHGCSKIVEGSQPVALCGQERPQKNDNLEPKSEKDCQKKPQDGLWLSITNSTALPNSWLYCSRINQRVAQAAHLWLCLVDRRPEKTDTSTQNLEKQQKNKPQGGA